MLLNMLKAKIHRAAVTECDLHYEGSITIDPLLLAASGILPFEQVDVLNINNGARFTTYAIAADEKGKGDIKINGAAARLASKGDLVIICTFASMAEEEAKKYKPAIIMVDEKNCVRKA